MNAINIVALSILSVAVLLHAAAICLHYAPRVRCPLVRRLRLVRHVRMVTRIRDRSSSLEVKDACTALLHALIR